MLVILQKETKMSTLTNVIANLFLAMEDCPSLSSRPGNETIDKIEISLSFKSRTEPFLVSSDIDL